MIQDASQFTKIDIRQLRAGFMLGSPVYDVRVDRKILLLAAGAIITESLLTRLRDRGITHVRIDRLDLRRMTHGNKDDGTPGADVDAADRPQHRRDAYFSQQRAGVTPDISAEAFLYKVSDRGASSYDKHLANAFAENHAASLNRVEALFNNLEKSQPANVKIAAAVSEESLADIAQDIDLFVAMGISPEADKYPPRHSLQTAMLAMSMGACLRLNEHQLIELGTGCMLHDAGMLHVSQKIHRFERRLTKGEFMEITKHSSLAFEMLRKVKSVSGNALGVVYQMHERCNGSGYPRRLDGKRIKQAAKIAAVADVFLALISPRPHRSGVLPYFAVEQILKDVNRGLFDRSAARGLLHTTSLFPIGSYVEVSDGRTGRVVRSNGVAYTRPVVEVWAGSDFQSEPEVVDLVSQPTLSIVRPLPVLKPSVGRLPIAKSA